MSDLNPEEKRPEVLQPEVTPKIVSPEVEQLKALVRQQAEKNGAPAASATPVSMPPEVKRLLPNLAAGLPLTLFLQLLGALLGFGLWYLAAQRGIHIGAVVLIGLYLPMQIYWALSLRRLGNVMELAVEQDGAPQPYRLGPICVWSCLTLLLAVNAVYLFSFSTGIYFLVNLIAVYVAYAGGRFIDRVQGGRKMALIAMLPQLLSLLWCLTPEASRFGNLSWPLAQFLTIAFLQRALLNLRIASPVSAAVQAVAAAESPVRLVGDEVVVRYRAFPAIERWMKQRISKTIGLPKRVKYVLAYSFGVLSIFGVAQIASIINGLLGATGGQGSPQNEQMNIGFIAWLITLPLVLLAGANVAYASRPRFVAFGPNGLRFIWSKHPKAPRRAVCDLSWNDIQHISLTRPENKTSPLDDVLTFSSGKRTIKLNMASLDSIEAREAILNAIQRWGGTISRDARVVEALQPPADHSYTELWLQALAAPPKRERLKPLLPDAMLRDGRYRVIGSLGVGGQGQAYLAADTAGGGQVVLKEFILPVFVDVTVRRSALEQFENEARILRQLDHAKIVQLRDFFVEDHRAYLVLEHIEGVSLRQLVEKEGKLQEQQVRGLAGQMCEILAYLHGLEPPVVHRDFTPDNLILHKDGTLKLIDFNVAKQIENTTVGTVVGKYAYLPPEQFRGMPGVQSDLYALGATLHYLLTGQDPEPISVSHPILVNDQVSAKLDEVVAKATALDLNKRYRKAEEIAADLSSAEGI